MGSTGSAYSRQFDAKLNDLTKQRIDVFAFNVAVHLFYSKPTHAQIDRSVVDTVVELEFFADSDTARGSIRRVETNHVRYGSNDIATRLAGQRLETAKQKVMEYGIQFEPDRSIGNTVYMLPQQMAVEDIDKALLDQIFTGSNIMPAVGAPIPAALRKNKLSTLDLIAVANAYGYSTPESALEKIRRFYERLMSREIALSE